MLRSGGKSLPGRRNSPCRGPETGPCLVRSRNSKTSVAGAMWAKGREVEVGQGDAGKDRTGFVWLL